MHFVSFVIAVAIIGVDAQNEVTEAVGLRNGPIDEVVTEFGLNIGFEKVDEQTTKLRDSGDDSEDDGFSKAKKKREWSGMKKAKATADLRVAEKEREAAEAALKVATNVTDTKKAAAKLLAARKKAVWCEFQLLEAEEAETSTRDEVDRLAKLQRDTDVSRRARAEAFAKAEEKARADLEAEDGARAKAKALLDERAAKAAFSKAKPKPQGPKDQNKTGRAASKTAKFGGKTRPNREGGKDHDDTAVLKQADN